MAAIEVVRTGQALRVRLSGDWTLSTMPRPLSELETSLRGAMASTSTWDLRGIGRLDSAAATLIWRAWGKRWPAFLSASDDHRAVLARIEALPADRSPTAAADRWASLVLVGRSTWALLENLAALMALMGQLVLDVWLLCARPRDIPWREFSANLYRSGAQALPVTALIGFLIGVVLSYLSALQLRAFGADVYVVNLLGIGIVRELGPMLVAVLVAGRSGSAMTAQIGVMRVTEEVDALATMGVSRSLRLILPKVAALVVAMPLLVIWCSAAGIVGGMVAANIQMDLSYGYFIDTLPKVVPVANLWIGVGKGIVFGFLIALLACHFGLRVQPNTASLSSRTTTSVVTSITVAILVDAVIAILTRGLGNPL